MQSLLCNHYCATLALLSLLCNLCCAIFVQSLYYTVIPTFRSPAHLLFGVHALGSLSLHFSDPGDSFVSIDGWARDMHSWSTQTLPPALPGNAFLQNQRAGELENRASKRQYHVIEHSLCLVDVSDRSPTEPARPIDRSDRSTRLVHALGASISPIDGSDRIDEWSLPMHQH